MTPEESKAFIKKAKHIENIQKEVQDISLALLDLGSEEAHTIINEDGIIIKNKRGYPIYTLKEGIAQITARTIIRTLLDNQRNSLQKELKEL
jgi:hypothetical protein